MLIDGLDGLSADALERELAAGGRFVVYEWCVSLVVLTLRRPTRPRFVRGGASGVWHGLPWTLLSLACGWWGLPWGVVLTPLAVWTNLAGGHDVTEQVSDLARAAVLARCANEG